MPLLGKGLLRQPIKESQKVVFFLSSKSTQSRIMVQMALSFLTKVSNAIQLVQPLHVLTHFSKYNFSITGLDPEIARPVIHGMPIAFNAIPPSH